MKRLLVLYHIFLLCFLTASSQDLRELHHFDDVNSNLEGHITQIVQDRNGFIWLATWNGLFRFDGYEFCRLKPLAGDGCSMTSDRIRDIWLSKDGDIFLRSDDGRFRFDISEYRFCDITTDEEMAESEETLHSQTLKGSKIGNMLQYIDPQGLYWQVIHSVLYCKMRTESPIMPLQMEQEASVANISRDNKGRIWVTTKQDATVRLLTPEGNDIGYLTPSGALSTTYASFGHPIYTVYQMRDGSIWLGSKPDGLFRLKETGSGNFTVEHIPQLQRGSVYSLAEDNNGRLWVGMLGDGLACVENPDDSNPTIARDLAGYPNDSVAKRVRRVYINNNNILMATTNNGIVIGQLKDNTNDIQFKRHGRDFRRPSSLYCNATMDMVETTDGRLFVSTETDGIYEIISPDLLADTLSFKRYNVENGMLPSDMICAMAQGADGQLFVACDHQIVNLDVRHGTFENMGHLFFRHQYHFTEANPLLLSNDRWLIGTTEDAFLLPQSLAHRSDYQPRLLLTGISIQNKQKMLNVETIDTLVLKPAERNVTIHFAALDYTDPAAIKYQFRLGTDSTSWNNIGTDHSVTLLDLRPGTYTLSLRSTNADGQWTNNVRSLTIIVEPTFWETPWATMLLILMAVAVLTSVCMTWLYIRRIRKRQQDTLARYLELLEKQAAAKQQEDSGEKTDVKTAENWEDNASQTPVSNDPFMQSVIEYVEKNISNSEADVSQMADACSMSRSALQRHIKQATGLTPVEFLREARMNHARQLLRTTMQTVSEVAYNCGFNDPKYFSRYFKNSTGMSPSEFKQNTGS
ncbi:MAG: helix-turn-helix domain-containing protein [Prevotella sp.]|nr:helix-turn-helix domain-containing protein [Prevotella sp.]